MPLKLRLSFPFQTPNNELHEKGLDDPAAAYLFLMLCVVVEMSQVASNLDYANCTVVYMSLALPVICCASQLHEKTARFSRFVANDSKNA